MDTLEIDIAENKRDHWPMSLQWTMSNIADRVGHETRESGIDPCPCARIQYALAEWGAVELQGPTEAIDRACTAIEIR